MRKKLHNINKNCCEEMFRALVPKIFLLFRELYLKKKFHGKYYAKFACKQPDYRLLEY